MTWPGWLSVICVGLLACSSILNAVPVPETEETEDENSLYQQLMLLFQQIQEAESGEFEIPGFPVEGRALFRITEVRDFCKTIDLQDNTDSSYTEYTTYKPYITTKPYTNKPYIKYPNLPFIDLGNSNEYENKPNGNGYNGNSQEYGNNNYGENNNQHGNNNYGGNNNQHGNNNYGGNKDPGYGNNNYGGNKNPGYGNNNYGGNKDPGYGNNNYGGNKDPGYGNNNYGGNKDPGYGNNNYGGNKDPGYGNNMYGVNQNGNNYLSNKKPGYGNNMLGNNQHGNNNYGGNSNQNGNNNYGSYSGHDKGCTDHDEHNYEVEDLVYNEKYDEYVPYNGHNGNDGYNGNNGNSQSGPNYDGGSDKKPYGGRAESVDENTQENNTEDDARFVHKAVTKLLLRDFCDLVMRNSGSDNY